ncbi:CLIP domain-containing serine protease 14D [Folsomia candida]|uniref:CLIP domain-containing serine protease n=1 Tax=Folsomia candida TaxID=158441 RepID=A0A226EST1_FOLCA|nr:CLIP domain-containing serine protease 14D [Folsomia candida]OXA60559.1 Serine protease easter [Folsomia candida]
MFKRIVISSSELLFLGSLLVLCILPCSESVQCRSYGKQLGECVPITNCPRLLAILLSSERTVQDLRMLQKLTCITEISDLERDPVVCCPIKEIADSLKDHHDDRNESLATEIPVSISTTTTTTTTPPPTPHASGQASIPQKLIDEKFHLIPALMDCSNAITSDRIIGGEVVPHGSLPWMARLGYRHKGTGKLEYYCGGSVINKRYILTAGHCTQGFDDNFVLAEVRLGEHDTTTDVDCNQDLGNICSLVEDFKIERIITHPQHNTVTKQNDIALLRLNQDISFGSYFVQPICLPFTAQYNLTALTPTEFNSLTTTVAGWGRVWSDKTQGSSQLLQVAIPIVPMQQCQQLYRRRVTITPKQICAGGVLGKDSCSGDSGGALMGTMTIPNKFSKTFQFGIVSFGQIQCGGPLPGVYTKTEEYLPWILSNIEA